jgi:hypothetical protein
VGCLRDGSAEYVFVALEQPANDEVVAHPRAIALTAAAAARVRRAHRRPARDT